MSLKIMVVDDEPAIAQLIRSLAGPLDHTVLAFEDTEKAGQRAEEQRFDVAFVGMRMPDLSGLELARRIRASQANRDTAIVMLSANDDIPTMRQAFGEGADFVLTKPVGANRIGPMLAAMESPRWRTRRQARMPLFTPVDCAWGDQTFSLRSMNISESGMLLEPSLEIAEGEEVSLEFKIGEIRASLHPRARIIRREGAKSMGVEFIDLTPEDQNAIQLYVMGRLASGPTREREASRPWWLGQGFLN